jgi:hypothetical protein
MDMVSHTNHGYALKIEYRSKNNSLTIIDIELMDFDTMYLMIKSYSDRLIYQNQLKKCLDILLWDILRCKRKFEEL